MCGFQEATNIDTFHCNHLQALHSARSVAFFLTCRTTLVSTDVTPSDQQLQCLSEWARTPRMLTVFGTDIMVSVPGVKLESRRRGVGGGE